MFLKAVALTIAMTCSPKDIRMILMDGKALDLASFERLPHCGSVVTDADDAMNMLRNLEGEMVRRQKILKRAAAKDLWAYQTIFKQQNQRESEWLPSLVVIIDEVQAFCGENPNEFGRLLRRLTQQGRASGIILVLATQRPTVDILQGSIKANLTGRISFRLPTQTDSRVILDHGGAEALTGTGDLIAMENSIGPLQRFQAPLVSESEIERLCQYFSTSAVEALPHSFETKRERGSKKGTPCIELPKPSPVLSRPLTRKASLPSRFAEVCLPHRTLMKHIERDCPERSSAVALFYAPFLMGRIESRLRTGTVLFEPVKGFFVTSGNPFHTVPLDECLKGLNGERALLKSIIKMQRPSLLDIITGRSQPSVDMAQHEKKLWRLLEAGFLTSKSDGLSLVKDYVTPPVLRHKLHLELLPEKEADTLSLEVDVPMAISRLRRNMAELWGKSPTDCDLVGMPFYFVRFNSGETLVFAAWAKVFSINALKGLLANNALLDRMNENNTKCIDRSDLSPTTQNTLLQFNSRKSEGNAGLFPDTL